MAGLQAVAHGHPFVEHKTFALPQALVCRHGFEVFEDAAVQMVDLVIPQVAQVGGGLFAADAPGAEHGHLGLAAQQRLVVFHPLRQFAEAAGARVDGPLKSANCHLVVVARVHHHHVGLADQLVPLVGRHIGAGVFGGLYVGHTQGDDLALQADLHAVERVACAQCFFVLQRRQTRVVLQPGQHRTHTVHRACDGAVDTFGRQQHVALDLVRGALGQQVGAQGRGVVQRDKTVKRGGEKGLGHWGGRWRNGPF